jgi:2-dehydro-3-deoxygluconokinase
MSIPLKDAAGCRYDLLSLGEVMLRLDPGEGRVHTARQFAACEGGGEYNFADNPVRRLLEDFILQGGVDASLVRWVPYDGIGRNVRNGLNFTERGFGVRGAVGTPDRGHTAASQLKPGDFDWEHIFGELGVRWLHTGGIFAALSETSAALVVEALQAAKRHGTIVSYDLNYRPSLWKSIGGKAKAQAVNREIARYVDVMIGNEEDFTASLGFEVAGVDENISAVPLDSFETMIKHVVADYPNFLAIATTLRAVRSATVNDWSAVLWHDGAFHASRSYEGLEIMDRVGGGDSFASGLIYGFLKGATAQEAVDYGAAHGALAMTTPGDTSMATRDEVEKLMRGGSARVVR